MQETAALADPVTDERTMNLDGVQIRLRSPHPEVWLTADRIIGSFEAATWDRAGDTMDIMLTSDASVAHVEPAEVDAADGKVQIAWGRARAEWDPDRRHCAFYQPQSDFEKDVGHPEYGFASVVRILYSFRLAEASRLLLHAAGIIRNERGYLFLGVSGAGKSTVSRLSKGHGDVLSDDLTMVSFAEPTPQVAGTPFHGELGIGVPGRAPLAGLYFLRQAGENRLDPLSPREALGRLMRCLFFFTNDRPTLQPVLDLAHALCENTPAYELHFTRDDTFWGLIDA